MASKLTLEKLRKEPQFIDLVFAAKTNRTKMEEEPVQNVPITDQEADFIIANPVVEANAEEAAEVIMRAQKKRERRAPMYRTAGDDTDGGDTSLNLDDKEFDLSHISAKEQSREDIIAAAEAAAFGNE